MKKRFGFGGINRDIFNVDYITGANKLKGFLILILLISVLTFFVPQASATFSLGTPNYSISDIYGPSQDISGWLNISFSGESLDSLFESDIGSEDNSINLSDLLEKNPGYAKTCSPVDCGADYSAISGATSKQATLIVGEEKIYGLRLTGNIGSISSIGFNVQSDAVVSCVDQIKIDIFNDGVIDFINNKSTSEASCSIDSGCYIDTGGDSEYDLTGQYCQKINLSESPGFVLGAWVKKSGERNVTIGLFDSSLSEIKNCKLPDANASGEYVSCSVDYSVKEQGEYYACVYPTAGSGIYKIKGHTTTAGAGCGFSGVTMPGTMSAAYDIFAQGRQFDSPGTLQISNSLPGGNSISDLATEYLDQRYASLDCSSECVIPIKLISEANQNITLSNLALTYTQQSVGQLTETRFYDVGTEPAMITSGFQRLYLDAAGFTVPDNVNRNYTFSLEFNGDSVLSEKIQIKDVPVISSLTPVQAAAGFPQEFIAKISSKYNLTRVTWDFGDGTPGTTLLGSTGNKTIHTYSQIGEYPLTIDVTDSRGLSGKRTFLINVTSPRDLIALNLAQMKLSLVAIKSGMSTLDAFSKSAINFSLSLPITETSLNSIESRYNAATEEQLSAIVADLLRIRLPSFITKTKTSSGAPLFSSESDVDLNALESIAGGTIGEGSREDYAAAAAYWAFYNLNVNVSFNEFSGAYNGNLEPIVKTFRITAREDRDISYDYYLIMPALDGFYSENAFRNQSGYVYINMKDYNTVTFSTTEDVDVINLPAFISPSVSRLNLAETTLPEEEKKNKGLIFGLVFFALLFAGIIVYVILQQWYKRKYEKHLFPNRNDLYNMANYIHNAKKKGMTNSDIESNLKKAGWSAEKIRYAMRKYAGKRTGMLEIPITKIVGKVEEKAKK